MRGRWQAMVGSAFTITDELGGGGMSPVFVADDHALGRRIVIKVLPRELANAEAVQRFKREIALVAALQHQLGRGRPAEWLGNGAAQRAVVP